MNLPTYLIEFEDKDHHFMVANPPNKYADYCNEVLVKNKHIELVDAITMYTPQSKHPTERILNGSALLVVRKGEHIREINWLYGDDNISYVAYAGSLLPNNKEAE